MRPVFLNRRAAGLYRALASIIPGPRLIKRIYQAAVSQKLRTTALDSNIWHKKTDEPNGLYSNWKAPSQELTLRYQ
jgi:hypothetical protein